MTTEAQPSSLFLRLAKPEDEPQLLGLVEQARWNQTAHDWHQMMALAPQGVWVMDEKGLAVASVSVLAYQERQANEPQGQAGRGLAWVGMLIVDTNHRRMGIATRLLDHAVTLGLKTCSCVKLDATEDGRRVYRQHGFEDEYTLVRFTADTIKPIKTAWGSEAQITPMREADLVLAIQRDRTSLGVDRSELLTQLYQDAPELAYMAWQGGNAIGFCLGRAGRRFTQIGPVQADRDAVGAALIAQATMAVGHQAWTVDVLELHSELIDRLSEMGFVFQRRLYRMFYKTNGYPGQTASSMAIAGYEFG